MNWYQLWLWPEAQRLLRQLEGLPQRQTDPTRQRQAKLCSPEHFDMFL